MNGVFTHGCTVVHSWMHCGALMDALWCTHGRTVVHSCMHCRALMHALWCTHGCMDAESCASVCIMLEWGVCALRKERCGHSSTL
eukprot:1139636-Pelagomonas_calceolata.AAC.3